MNCVEKENVGRTKTAVSRGACRARTVQRMRTIMRTIQRKAAALHELGQKRCRPIITTTSNSLGSCHSPLTGCTCARSTPTPSLTVQDLCAKVHTGNRCSDAGIAHCVSRIGRSPSSEGGNRSGVIKNIRTYVRFCKVETFPALGSRRTEALGSEIAFA